MTELAAPDMSLRSAQDSFDSLVAVLRVADGKAAIPFENLVSAVPIPARMSPPFPPQAGLLGIVEHSGRPIPLVDLALLIGLKSERPLEQRMALVVRAGDRWSGLVVDAVEGLAPHPKKARVTLAHIHDGRDGPVAAVACSGNGEPPVLIFDSDGLQGLNGMVFSDTGHTRDADDPNTQRGEPMTSFLTYDWQGTTYAAEVGTVAEIIKAPPVEAHTISMPGLVGKFTHRGESVLVLTAPEQYPAPAEFEQPQQPDYVLLVHAEGHKFGVPATAIGAILRVEKSKIAHMPEADGVRERLIPSVLPQSEGQPPVLVTEPGTLARMEAFADLLDRERKRSFRAAEIEKSENMQQPTSMVCLDIGPRVYAETADLLELAIVDASTTFLRGQAAQGIGYIAHRGESAMLIDLATCLGYAPTTHTEKLRVAFLRGENSLIGFVVQNFLSIEHFWLSDTNTKEMGELPSRARVHPAFRDNLSAVSARDRSGNRVISTIDLAGVAKAMEAAASIRNGADPAIPDESRSDPGNGTALVTKKTAAPAPYVGPQDIG